MALTPFNHPSKPCVRNLYNWISEVTYRYGKPIDFYKLLPERRKYEFSCA